MFSSRSTPPAAGKLLAFGLVAVLGLGLSLAAVARGAMDRAGLAPPLAGWAAAAAGQDGRRQEPFRPGVGDEGPGDSTPGDTGSGDARSGDAGSDDNRSGDSRSGDPATAASNGGGQPRTAEGLLSDAEFVYGPPDRGLDVDRLVSSAGGALARYRGSGAGGSSTGSELLRQVSRDHSVSPRLLVALLNFEDGPSSGPSPAGWTDGGARLAGAGLDGRLGAMAASLARGFYGFKYRGLARVALGNRQDVAGPAGANAATFAVARYLAGASASADDWQDRLHRFTAAYAAVAGGQFDPRGGLPAAGLRQPPLLVPWPEGETWSFTGGPHGSWGVDSAWGAVDFAPPSRVGCGAAPEWVVASAPGIVVRSETGHVAVDLDGDGYEGTGWVLSYFHMADQGRPPVGTPVEAGDRIGHPSCVGGRSTGAHLHFMRRFDGEWLPAAGGPAPLDLSGWAFQSFGAEYDGAMSHPAAGERFAATSRLRGPMEVASDNGPARRAALAAAWAPYREPGTAVERLASASRPQAAGDQAAGLGARANDQTVASPNRTAADSSAIIDGATVSGAPTAQTSGAWVGGPDAPSLGITLTLAGRSHHETPFILGLAQGSGTSAVLMGHSAATGETESLALPPSLEPGVYTLTVRAPGFLPGNVVNVPLGHGHVQVDLSAGGVTPLVPGEINGDDRVTLADAWSWLLDWRAGGRASDVDGDGRVGLGDLRVVLSNRGRR